MYCFLVTIQLGQEGPGPEGVPHTQCPNAPTFGLNHSGTEWGEDPVLPASVRPALAYRVLNSYDDCTQTVFSA